MKKILKIGVPLILILLAFFLWWRFYFVFGEGVSAGNLNYVVKKGYVFKTWEGKIIQVGFKTPVSGGMQSNEFNFSVANDSLGAILERCNGKHVEVRYKEYLQALPWRGMHRHVVVEVLKISEEKPAQILPY